MISNTLEKSYEDVITVTRGPFSRRWGYLLALTIVFQFSLIVNASWRAQPDAALYLELGESLAAGNGYIFNGEHHTYVPPAYPAVIALVNVLLGKKMLYYRVFMSVLGLMTGLLCYLLIRRLCGKETAFLLGGFCMTSHVLLENATMTCSDTLFAFSVFLAIHSLLSVGTRSAPPSILMTAVSGIMAGLPALVRINGWGIPPALFFFLAHTIRNDSLPRRLAKSALFLGAGITPGMAWEFYKASFPRSLNEGTYMNAILGRDIITQISIVLKALKDYAYEVTYACTGMSIKTGFVESIIPILIIIGLLRLMRKGERLFGPLVVIQMAGLCLSPAGSRYLIALLPAFSFFLVEGVTCVSEALSRKFSGSMSSRVAAKQVVPLFVFSLIVLNVGSNMVTIIQARSALDSNGAESSRDVPFFAASRWLKQHAHNGLVITMHPRVIHYLSGLPTIELVRSGVPENEALIHSSDEIIRLIARRRPSYFFSDSKNHIMKKRVDEAFQKIGATLQEIPGIDQDHRFALWKIVYP